MSYTKRDMIKESICNTVIGMITSYIISYAVLSYMLGLPVSARDNFIVTIVLTVVSILRGYLVRLYFYNKRRKVKHES